MFLMTPTKIEVVLVGVLISGAPSGGFALLSCWWVLVAMMLTGAILLARGLKAPYRIVTVSLTAVALVLFVDFTVAQDTLGVMPAFLHWVQLYGL